MQFDENVFVAVEVSINADHSLLLGRFGSNQSLGALVWKLGAPQANLVF
jgi:hypothetical protein